MSKPPTVVCFGEILLRLSPPSYERFSQARFFEVHYGGAEANVAAQLSNFGTESRLVSKLPNTPIGDSALQFFRSFGVKTDFIARGGERLGIYYLENGSALRPSQVIYDRAHSSITTLEPDEIQWEEVLKNADWFHFTGITVALGETVRASLHQALETAKRMGVSVSCDLNYRAKLWSVDHARRGMIPLMRYVDVCISNEGDASTCLGVFVSEKGELLYSALAQKLKSEFGFKAVALSVRSSAPDEFPNTLTKAALLLDDADCKTPTLSRTWTYQPSEHIGGGDAFTAGLIFGLLSKKNSKDALDFAVACSVLKQSVSGDVGRASIQEVESLLSNSTAKVLR
jgi:2-dehydro-3-deoxygluconokinase